MTKSSKITLGVIGGFFAFIALIIFAAFAMTSGPVKATEAELALLRSGDVEQAYAALASDFRSSVPATEFDSFLATYPVFTKSKKVSFSSREVVNDESTLKGTLTAEDGTATRVEFRLVKEEGMWRIVSMQVLTGGIEVVD
ncbi:MAG: DUF4864 domain-containing protein [Patescibacteria group bacterium]